MMYYSIPFLLQIFIEVPLFFTFCALHIGNKMVSNTELIPAITEFKTKGEDKQAITMEDAKQCDTMKLSNIIYSSIPTKSYFFIIKTNI